MKLSIDFETRSLADLSEVGAWNYSLHESTVVLMCAISADGGKATCFDCRQPDVLNVVERMLQDADEIHAWNVGFEYALITNVLKLEIPVLRFLDTMAKACAFSMPASLGKCGAALNLPIQKDKEGDRLMKLFSMPATAGKLKGQLRDMTPELESEYVRYMDYCRQDVEAEMAIDAALPDLTGDDLAFWRTTWITNLRGIPIDMELVTSLQKMVERGEKVIGSAVSERTDGALDGYVLKNNHNKVSKYLDLPSVAKAYVKEVLARADVDPKTRELLEARQALGRTAVAKLPKFKNYASVVDHRVRDAHRFNGAQSGRDTSLGINLMNLPRGAKFDVPKLIACAKADDWEGFFETAKYHFGKSGPVPVLFDPLGAVVACLRGCIAPKQGVLYQCDYASIEPRVLAWYSGQEWELEAWRKYDAKQGPDLYKVFAGKAWGIEPDAVSGDQRQLGKVGKLACFSSDTEILTDEGYKRITEITRDDRVWDGCEFVLSDGVVYQGEKTCLSLNGLRITPDHKIHVGRMWMSAREAGVVGCYLQSALNLATTPSWVTNSGGRRWGPRYVANAAWCIGLRLAIYAVTAQVAVKRALRACAKPFTKPKPVRDAFAPTLRIGADCLLGLTLRTGAALTRTIGRMLITEDEALR